MSWQPLIGIISDVAVVVVRSRTDGSAECFRPTGCRVVAVSAVQDSLVESTAV